MKKRLPLLLLYVFSFLLLLEWLRPIEQLAGIKHIEIFFIFMLLSFLLSYFQLSKLLSSSMKIVFIIISLNLSYEKTKFLNLTWLKLLLINIKDNILFLYERKWTYLSSDFRAILIFLILWLLVSLMEFWIVRKQRMFLFFVLTIILVIVLDIFTPNSGKIAIVQTVVSGFTVMGILTYDRMKDRDHKHFWKWIVSLASIIVFSVFAGFIGAKLESKDPVSLQKVNNNMEGKVKTTGYRSNDTHLGGPFEGNNDVVFMVEASSSHYWQIETRDTYTGKGWTSSRLVVISFREGENVPFHSISTQVPGKEEKANLKLKKGFPFLLYPEGIKEILPQDGNTFEYDPGTNRISAFTNQHAAVELDHYSILFKNPSYSINNLMEQTGNEGSIPLEFFQRYTQLPKGLPSRIKRLTEKITAGKENWFNKAQAIESYLDSKEFTYDQKNIPIPEKNEDYVDQFLFKTKQGYCDNFSTAMVVMLRTIGIPARWVKGYTGGVPYSQDGKKIYKVTNNNAHTWVEVYFPNQGWVPFEPTKGFVNQIEKNYESDKMLITKKTPAPPEKSVRQEESKKDSMDSLWRKGIYIFTAFVIVFILLYQWRRIWIGSLLLLCYKNDQKDELLVPAYMALLKQLHRYGLKRKPDQTLRNYAQDVDSYFSTSEMTELTLFYEQFIYDQNLPKGSWKKGMKIWRNLMKQTIW